VPGAVAQGRLGKRSVILALSAFAAGALAITILVAIPSDASKLAQNIATGFFMAVFLLAAPLAHITGGFRHDGAGALERQPRAWPSGDHPQRAVGDGGAHSPGGNGVDNRCVYVMALSLW
jgi:hypothetical protein